MTLVLDDGFDSPDWWRAPAGSISGGLAHVAGTQVIYRALRNVAAGDTLRATVKAGPAGAGTAAVLFNGFKTDEEKTFTGGLADGQGEFGPGSTVTVDWTVPAGTDYVLAGVAGVDSSTDVWADSMRVEVISTGAAPTPGTTPDPAPTPATGQTRTLVTDTLDDPALWSGADGLITSGRLHVTDGTVPHRRVDGAAPGDTIRFTATVTAGGTGIAELLINAFTVDAEFLGGNPDGTGTITPAGGTVTIEYQIPQGMGSVVVGVSARGQTGVDYWLEGVKVEAITTASSPTPPAPVVVDPAPVFQAEGAAQDVTQADGLVRLRVVRPVRGGWREVTIKRRTRSEIITVLLFVTRGFRGLLTGHGAPPDGLTSAYIDLDTATLYLPPAPSDGVDHGAGAPPAGDDEAWLDDATGQLHVPVGVDPRETLAALRGVPATVVAPYVDPDTMILYVAKET